MNVIAQLVFEPTYYDVVPLHISHYTKSDGWSGVHTFPKGISLKVNVIAQLVFQPTYYDVVPLHISHYASSGRG